MNKLVKIGNGLFRTRSFWPALLLIPSLYFRYTSVDVMSEYLFEVSLSISLAGFLVRFITIGYSAPNTSGRNTGGHVADSLNTTGTYSISRNPIYFGNSLIWTGVSLQSHSVLFFILTISLFFIFYLLIILAEEDFLKQKFGEPYEKWIRSTPRFFLLIWRWSKPNTSFNWKKVLYQEKAGILNLVIVFWLFDLMDNLKLGEQIPVLDTKNLILISAIAFYSVVKVLQRINPLYD